MPLPSDLRKDLDLEVTKNDSRRYTLVSTNFKPAGSCTRGAHTLKLPKAHFAHEDS